MLAEQSSLAAILTFFALGTSLVICLCADSIGAYFGVMDVPDNTRKYHTRPTPLVGGLAILVPVAIWLVASMAVRDVPPRDLAFAFLLPMLGTGLVGFTDDQSSLAPVSRILFLLLFLATAFVLQPSFIADTVNWGSFAPVHISPVLFCLLMAVSAVGVVNAVNMADGQNGIVPSMFVIWSACLIMIGDPHVNALAQILFGASFVVLLFNLSGRLFLGDCGSYGVTFVIGLATMLTYAERRVSIETVIVWFFIPVVDCLRLMITRALRGCSPMQADHDHFHHRLQREFGPQYGLVAYIGAVALSSLTAATAPHLSLLCIIVLTAFYCSFAGLAESSAAGQTAAVDTDSDSLHSLNVISLPAQDSAHERGPIRLNK